MPLLLAGLFAGSIGGFFTGGGVSGAGNIIKYGVIGVILYFAAKQFGLIK